MPDDITLRKADGTWVVRAGGAVLAEPEDALELTEGSYPPVIYFPREDVAMAFVERSNTQTTSPKMGAASYFTLVTKSGQIRDAGWSYETPTAGLEAIAGHIAFYPDKVAVERV